MKDTGNFNKVAYIRTLLDIYHIPFDELSIRIAADNSRKDN